MKKNCELCFHSKIVLLVLRSDRIVVSIGQLLIITIFFLFRRVFKHSKRNGHQYSHIQIKLLTIRKNKV